MMDHLMNTSIINNDMLKLHRLEEGMDIKLQHFTCLVRMWKIQKMASNWLKMLIVTSWFWHSQFLFYCRNVT